MCKKNSDVLTRISEPIFLWGSFFLCFLLYLPALHGQPIWDDRYFWFQAPEMKLAFWQFWSFSWPVTVVTQKILQIAFAEHFLYYHLFNLGLHFLNAFLVLRLAQKLNLPFARWIFLLFLIHPANVISVAWMIQMKTLLCFLFAILAIFSFLKGLQTWTWMSAAMALFLLSLFAKSSAVTMPILLFGLAWMVAPEGHSRPGFKKKWLWALPMLALSAAGAWLLIARNPAPSGSAPRASVELVLQTAHYYLQQSLFPLENPPIVGHAAPKINLFIGFNMVFVLAGLFYGRRTLPARLLISGYVFLLPFLGIVYAPYMAVTWVSEQHLYLALPLLLAFWLSFAGRLVPQFVVPLASLAFIFFAFKTYEATRFFVDESAFYSESLRADPSNVPVVYNFAALLVEHNQSERALEMVEAFHQRAEVNPELRFQAHESDLEDLRRKLRAAHTK